MFELHCAHRVTRMLFTLFAFVFLFFFFFVLWYTLTDIRRMHYAKLQHARLKAYILKITHVMARALEQICTRVTKP